VDRSRTECDLILARGILAEAGTPLALLDGQFANRYVRRVLSSRHQAAACGTCPELCLMQFVSWRLVVSCRGRIAPGGVESPLTAPAS